MKESQQQKILGLLRKMGPVGVNSYDLTYIYAIKQAPTRIKELREQGYQITSHFNKNRSVTYVLGDAKVTLHTPLEVTKQPWEEELVRVVKNGRVFWEKPENVETQQLALL